MGAEKTLYDEDAFETEFEDEFGLIDEAVERPSLETSDAPVQSPAEERFVGGEVEAAPPVEMAAQGGERPIPAISIIAFWEQDATHSLFRTAGRDRRMARASLELHEGGLDAAIAHQSENATPNLLVVESALPAAQMIAKIDELASYCDEGVEVLVVGAMNDIALYRQLVDRGVSEYLVPPIEPVDFIRSIASLFVDADTPFLGKLTSVIGAKGGVGASTIAHNLAWAMAEGARLNACLVDLDLSFGTTALDFNQDAAQTVADALSSPERTDDSVISRILTKATDRLSIFAAPATVSEVLEYSPEAYDTVIETVRRAMPHVILDLPHGWTHWLRAMLIASDDVVLVCQPDLASLRNGKNIIDHLKGERPNDAPPRLVVNMAGVPKRPEIPVKDFAAAIGIEPEIILPFEPQLFGNATNNGQMLSEADPQSKSALAVDHLASKLTGRPVAAQSKSFLQKLLRR